MKRGPQTRTIEKHLASLKHLNEQAHQLGLRVELDEFLNFHIYRNEQHLRVFEAHTAGTWLDGYANALHYATHELR